MFTIFNYVSIVGLLGIGSGILALVALWFTLIVLPDSYKKLAINSAIGLIALGATYQFAYARGVHVDDLRHRAAIAATEKAHKAAAAKITDEQEALRKQADAALVEAHKQLKELENAASKGPNPVCIDRGLARRLRSL